MAVNPKEAIKRARWWKKKGITYSMTGSRAGTDNTHDCSSFVYECYRYAGASKYSVIPSTETMHEWLKNNGFKLIAENKKFNGKPGDVVIFGKKGYSAGVNCSA
ncbi:MAG: hypothetical protein L0I93_05480 [Atopostipes suicloacalis]|nr:hypothetical protein [Tetragenococcus halophilus]MDN6195920.1 hypothetical protein [Atopostipes suicloacalis]MDN6343663.1 hypothetical protein [Tetragenococcus koreensis]MDN6718535.1 hypothetical protein [Lactococcus lactis]